MAEIQTLEVQKEDVENECRKLQTDMSELRTQLENMPKSSGTPVESTIPRRAPPSSSTSDPQGKSNYETYKNRKKQPLTSVPEESLDFQPLSRRTPSATTRAQEAANDATLDDDGLLDFLGGGLGDSGGQPSKKAPSKPKSGGLGMGADGKKPAGQGEIASGSSSKDSAAIHDFADFLGGPSDGADKAQTYSSLRKAKQKDVDSYFRDVLLSPEAQLKDARKKKKKEVSKNSAKKKKSKNHELAQGDKGGQAGCNQQ